VSGNDELHPVHWVLIP